MPTQTQIVQTSYGTVAGQVEDGIARFLGIPYAAAPVGELRFAAPARPAPWDGVREAFAFGPTPPKPTIDGQLGELMPDPSVPGDEWLNLNVWRPVTETHQLRPVMVWIHGGAFTTGSSAVTAYDGATFARDEVVCVSLNYRLGVDGFGYIPDAPLPANRGLHDQIAALEWVRDNIASFGGDPDNVTVFGESAGAMSVLTLLSLETGLFHKAIAQSGSGHIAQTAGDATLVLEAIAAQAGVEPTAQALAALPIEELIAAQKAVGADITTTADPVKYGESTIASCGMSLMPVIDGDLITRRPIDAIAAGAGSDVPLLAGTNTEEFRLFIVPTPMVYWLIAEQFRNRVEAYGAPADFYDHYKANSTEAYPRNAPSGIAAAVLTDRMFRIPTYRIAEARADSGADTHLYEFGWRSPVTPNTIQVKLGACHSLEIPFVWDTLELDDSRPMTGPTSPQDLAQVMHAQWVEFAQTGHPGWSAYDTGTRPVMTFRRDNGEDDVVVPDPRESERKLWEGHLAPVDPA
ncbi:carboxylesterase/lipase family protein [Streptomyces sp. NBC_00091]|uniref:carboxylesterase/lipase family protein n=1 Tax=Streptomyces sp. NBC_00091 TaxID=2975648 RepID=UPI00224FC8C1|nr:carboxylesterase family protein [Streptomyces sp. NBC_00091]MCX5380797.1 carboxylesterase family protein [Streptomyces sp. NBC_00091]